MSGRKYLFSVIFLIVMLLINCFVFYKVYLERGHDIKIVDARLVKKDAISYQYEIKTEADIRNFQKTVGTRIVPREAVLGLHLEPYVFVVELPPGAKTAVVQKKEVQVGLMNEEYVEIVQGLDPDEKVVVKGQNSLESSDLVKVTTSTQFAD